MEDRVLALKSRIMKHPLMKKENLNPKTWLNSDHVKDFTDFVLQKEPEADKDFDHVEMLLETEKEYIEAAKRNDVETMKLLGRGVNVNAKNVHNRTALHYAVACKNKEATDLLLKRRAKLDLQDKHGVTAVHLAAWFGSLEILKLLVQGGADQRVENLEGMNMMHCAALNNHTDIVAYIVDDLQMKELDKEDHHGNRPFALAADHGCVRMLQMMMEAPYNMATMEENQKGNTPLHLAAKNGHLGAVQLLLDYFEVRNEVNHAGETPLYLAADGAHEDCVLALLEADCDPNIPTTNNTTDCDPNIPTTNNTTPIHCVCEKGYMPVVKLLLDHGVQMNVQNQHLQTPFHLAVKNCHTTVIEFLLESCCDTDITDHLGQTALHIAAELGKVDVIEIILKAGVNMEIKDRQGKTALGVAARADIVIVVDMIIKAERYFSWRKPNAETNEDLQDEFSLTFKPDHHAETKQVRSILWNLAYRLLSKNEWKKLAEHWAFTEEQIAAIEEQWTGSNSYQEHGNRMLLIWLHGVLVAQGNPAKELYQGLIAIDNIKIAEKLRMEGQDSSKRKCTIS
ncbi:ankyrin repeat and death domain-containing protein 1B isoform X2 [Tachysurus fulvidraco]|uniref:ankyrin repeat and death domain-containing protein 1B isoform X2 n=1 Tax=Tachysurus fulvidraco TaxID=1234273 RepID=UPI001FF04185|nr:ankyrin repeat and death domain-containing protein 1B isoform X2 [Tachysurus fulvidraco]